MNYQELIIHSHKLLDHQQKDNNWKIFNEEQLVPENITIVAWVNGNYKKKISLILWEFQEKFPDQYIYSINNIHSTIAYFPLLTIENYVDEFIKYLQICIKDSDILYNHLWFLSSPNAEWLVAMFEPINWWKNKLVADLETKFWCNQWKKINNHVIDILIKQYARSYIMKFKKIPSIEEIEYIKSLSNRSFGDWEPNELRIYKTNSPLLRDAKLLWTITL